MTTITIIQSRTIIPTTTKITTMLDDFLVRAALAGVGLSLATGPLGSFVVWRKMAYFGDATAHLGADLHLCDIAKTHGNTCRRGDQRNAAEVIQRLQIAGRPHPSG